MAARSFPSGDQSASSTPSSTSRGVLPASGRDPVAPTRVENSSLGLAPHAAPYTIVSPSGANRAEPTRLARELKHRREANTGRPRSRRSSDMAEGRSEQKALLEIEEHLEASTRAVLEGGKKETGAARAQGAAFSPPALKRSSLRLFVSSTWHVSPEGASPRGSWFPARSAQWRRFVFTSGLPRLVMNWKAPMNPPLAFVKSLTSVS
jgi:hypothetical protein